MTFIIANAPAKPILFFQIWQEFAVEDGSQGVGPVCEGMLHVETSRASIGLCKRGLGKRLAHLHQGDKHPGSLCAVVKVRC